MPTNRTPLHRGAKHPGLIEIQTALVYDRPLPATRGLMGDAWVWAWRRDSAAYKGVLSGGELWASRRAEVLAWWIEARPGTRPSGWWRFDAPGPRQRIGGVGEPLQTREMTHGVPLLWNFGRHRNLGATSPPAPDPNNPPLYESEACYLDRRGLLVPGERDRLTDDDFAPARLTDVVDFGEDCGQ